MTDSTKNSLIGVAAIIAAAIIGGLFLYFSNSSRSNLSTATKETPISNIPSRDSIATKPDATPTKLDDAPPNYGRIFNDGDPYPAGFDKVKLGTPVSVLKSIYPDGDFGELTSYDVHPKVGPFSLVAFYYDEGTSSPKVERISFHYRDPTVTDELRKEALSAFGAKSLTTRVNGSLVWRNMKGCSVDIGLKWMSLEKGQR